LRGSLWESDRGADKIAFGKLDAAMTQNFDALAAIGKVLKGAAGDLLIVVSGCEDPQFSGAR